jgi:hypothetical protein
MFFSACGGSVVSGAQVRADPAPPPGLAPSAGRMMEQTAQAGPNDGPDGPVTPAERSAAVERLLAMLKDRYVFPDKAQKAQAAVRSRLRRGDYDKIGMGRELARTLTAHVNEVLKDAHFHVLYSAEKIPEDEKKGEPTPAERERHEAMGRTLNGGIERAERLPGNVGYLEVQSFEFVVRGGEAAAAAMNLLADTDALIIDIRRNGGGEPEMVAVLCSYFFGESVHLNDIYDRIKNETRQFWTSPSVPGRRYLGKDVYVLTSKLTGSGAEEFAYNLQQLKRATIVGERTWGGANPGELIRLSDHLAAFIPTGRAINPISKTNWEGTGVTPDIATAADDALRVAQSKAIERLIPKEKAPEAKKALEQRLKELSEGSGERK